MSSDQGVAPVKSAAGLCPDCSRTPDGLWLSRLLALPVRAYRLVLSPWIAPRCRFLPTCSDYAVQALQQHGPVTGIGLTVKRLLRCHPWGGSGLDEIPAMRCRCAQVRLPVASESQRADSRGKSAALRVFG
jgi:putative membrane protein insertion efficiency factor